MKKTQKGKQEFQKHNIITTVYLEREIPPKPCYSAKQADFMPLATFVVLLMASKL